MLFHATPCAEPGCQQAAGNLWREFANASILPKQEAAQNREASPAILWRVCLLFGFRLGHGTEGYRRIEGNSKKRVADGMKKAPRIEAGASKSVPILAGHDLS